MEIILFDVLFPLLNGDIDHFLLFCALFFITFYPFWRKSWLCQLLQEEDLDAPS